MSSKSQFQILSFLRNYTPKSDLDAKIIQSYLSTEFKISPKTPLFCPQSDYLPLDVQSFIQWLDRGLKSISVANFKNDLVILGNVTLETAKVIGILRTEDIDRVEACNLTVTADELTPASENDTQRFLTAMLASALQVDEKSLTLVPKYIPKPNEKVIFHSHNHNIIGLGVVRQVYADTGDVELYCYYIYPTVHHPSAIGYSMHELGVVNLRDYVFEDMLDDDNRSSSFNGVSCLRRMNRELERCGKIWKDKLHRIEPLQPKARKGEKYWYISDKLKVVQEREKDTPTSHFRYIAGNYFKSEMAALRMLDMWCQEIHRYMASDHWPEIPLE